METTATNNGTSITARILEAIDTGYRTVGAIKRATGVEPYKDITAELDGLIEDKRIRKLSNGTITAYFRFEQNPVKFWLDGDGKVKAEFGENFKPRDEAAKAEEFAGKSSFNSPISEKSAAVRTTEKPRFDLAKIEKAAADGLSKNKAAELLGIKPATFQWYFGKQCKNLDVKNAWNRGAAKSGANTAKTNRRGPYKRTKAADVEIAEMLIEPTPEPIINVVFETATEPAIAKPVNARYVTFERGGQILIGFEGSVFDLVPKEAALIATLADVLREFEAESVKV